MNHETLLKTLRSPSIALLRADNAALILSFLHQEFKAEPRQVRPLHELLESLDRYLERLAAYYPDKYPASAKVYITQWSEERGWLRIFRQGSDPDYQVELTTGAQQALAWAAELHPRVLLGTESRFAQILALLHEIVQRGSSDPATRIAYLQSEKQRIEDEIAHIESTGRVKGLSDIQLRERLQLATEQAELLLRDFTAVEERFRDIARLVQQEQHKPDVRKGAIVGTLLDADDRLRQSEVGRSFYAFWDYLQHPEQREALDHLLDHALDIAPDEGNPRSMLLRQMPYYLINAGLKVDQTNHRLAEQLRRALDEDYATESRRMRVLTAEIRGLFSTYADQIDLKRDSVGARIESLPLTQLVMARPLWSPKEDVLFPIALQNASDIGDDEMDAIRGLVVDQFYLDEQRVRDRIERVLLTKPSVSLLDILAHYPIEHGLPELLAYIQIAEQRDAAHTIDDSQRDYVLLPSADAKRAIALAVWLPRIIFRRPLS